MDSVREKGYVLIEALLVIGLFLLLILMVNQSLSGAWSVVRKMRVESIDRVEQRNQLEREYSK